MPFPFESLLQSGALGQAAARWAQSWQRNSIVDYLSIEYPDATRQALRVIVDMAGEAVSSARSFEDAPGSLPFDPLAAPSLPGLSAGSYHGTVIVTYINPLNGRRIREIAVGEWDHTPTKADISEITESIYSDAAARYGFDAGVSSASGRLTELYRAPA